MKRDGSTRNLRAGGAILTCLSLGLLLVVSPVGATAKNSSAPVARKLDPAEVENRSSQSKALVRVAGLFGDDEEEKARQQHEADQDATIQQLRQRVDDLEDALRRQTGQNEQLSHRVQELSQKMDRMQKDFDYKLCSMAQQQTGATSEEGFSCAQTSDQNAPLASNTAASNTTATISGPVQSTVPNGPAKLASPPGTLGTLPADTRLPQSNSQGIAPQATPSATQPEFDAAMDLLAKTQYAEARSAFRAFADAHPKDELTPKAVYWVGNIAFIQKDFQGAEQAFVEELKKYPTSPRAPESMLKLGQSLLALKQTKEGCTTLGFLPTKYANATKTIKDKAVAARKAAACK
jgi:tol-pal system protein YbgF